MTFLKAFVLAVLFAIPMLWAEARMRAPIPLTSQQFAGAPAGQPVKLIVRVDALGPQRLRGEVLARRTDSDYVTTGSHVELAYRDDVPIVMGAATDIVPGAVLFVDGTVTSPGRATVRRLVVVTKYVSVSHPKA
jgi:hypothetical protein